MDLLRRSGEHQLKKEVFDGTRNQVYDGVQARSGSACINERPRTEIAEDLGVGLSSLTRWVGQYRGDETPPEIKDDLQAELKRLRKENAVLRRERDILKKAAAFFAKEGSR